MVQSEHYLFTFIRSLFLGLLAAYTEKLPLDRLETTPVTWGKTTGQQAKVLRLAAHLLTRDRDFDALHQVKAQNKMGIHALANGGRRGCGPI